LIDKLVASGADDGQIQLQTTEKGELVHTLHAYPGKVKIVILMR
jgi:hypothetical protein